MSEERKRSAAPWISSVVLGLLVLYVLSIGPAMAWVARDTVSRSWLVERVYAPLLWLDTHSEIAAFVFDAYCGWWFRVTEP